MNVPWLTKHGYKFDSEGQYNRMLKRLENKAKTWPGRSNGVESCPRLMRLWKVGKQISGDEECVWLLARWAKAEPRWRRMQERARRNKHIEFVAEFIE